MPNNTQPTILVKKSDGTFARMSLGEIKKMKAGKGATNAPANPTPVIARNEAPKQSVASVIPAQAGIQASAVKPALRDSSVATLPQNDRAIVKHEILKQVQDDSKSLLEEDELGAKGTSVAVGRDNQVDTVIKKLSFSVAPSFSNRLRSAVQLRLKEVRGEKETRATVLRSIKDGGLGLTEPQASELESLCAEVGNLSARLPVKSKTDLMIEDQLLPQVFHELPLPVKTTPNNAFVHGAIPAKARIQNLTKEVATGSPIRSGMTNSEQPFKISPTPVAKTMMKDVVAKPLPVGPVEEIKFFTLTDFRRLSEDSAQAAKRLAQKFINLREESVLLFWQALDAWKQSPLFGDYVAVLNKVFAVAAPVASADNQKGISSAEIEAIIQMEKDLGI